jgi:hypothetical protein
VIVRQLGYIEALIEHLAIFKNLKKLSLHGNRILKLPHDLSDLRRL